eukprot:m.309637 g.309637  ORF g.309637 m.309637 type:complete len:72 (-) comp19642_c1_seq1:149-364(-)
MGEKSLWSMLLCVTEVDVTVLREGREGVSLVLALMRKLCRQVVQLCRQVVELSRQRQVVRCKCPRYGEHEY